jgi:predicted metalloprotease
MVKKLAPSLKEKRKQKRKRRMSVMAKRGLYANIHAKRKRIKAGSGEKMRKVGSKGAPTAANFKRSAKTAKPYKKKTKKK